ncbi:MAG TPA: FCD domain-containing protein [Amycolatopsis sp.]|nr:FCD domain-containing protein [Amycolatopsis sp.]
MPPKRATLIAQRIVQQIHEGKLSQGDPLPPEKDMLAAYGVGRNTLREALRVLELQGVITIRPGRGGGPVVAMPDSRHLASTLALLMQFASTPFRAIVETRMHVEPLTAQLCADRADARVLRKLRESVDHMAEKLDDAEVFLYENQRFHELVARGSGNPLFSYLLNSLDWITDGSALGIEYPERYRRAVLEAHQHVCKAIEAQDSDRALEAMRLHMVDTLKYFERKYNPVMTKVLTWEMYGS